jgi:hypothetical protein
VSPRARSHLMRLGTTRASSERRVMARGAGGRGLAAPPEVTDSGARGGGAPSANGGMGARHWGDGSGRRAPSR